MDFLKFCLSMFALQHPRLQVAIAATAQTYLENKSTARINEFNRLRDPGITRECCQPELITFFYPTSTETIFMNRRPILAHSGKFSVRTFLPDTSDVDSAKGWASVTDPDLLTDIKVKAAVERVKSWEREVGGQMCGSPGSASIVGRAQTCAAARRLMPRSCGPMESAERERERREEVWIEIDAPESARAKSAKERDRALYQEISRRSLTEPSNCWDSQ
ncbi:hypothetical protein DFH06DRAFT_1399779 [Mycena polygramma]|nr:hypothetical protein DFH06DRAFT_1399779 [Mycena polygramma]